MVRIIPNHAMVFVVYSNQWVMGVFQNRLSTQMVFLIGNMIVNVFSLKHSYGKLPIYDLTAINGDFS